jgi:ABC-type phosphate transport system substrate-binding protein
MIRSRVSALAAGAALVAGTLAVTTGTAQAAPTEFDPAFVPVAGDVVGTGSDTTQAALAYLAQAYNANQAAGSRLASFAAIGDPATITLRQGTTAIQRSTVNGSGNGKKLLYGTSNNTAADYARSSSSLSTTEVAAGLKQAAFGVDGLKMAVRKAGTNAPASLTAAQLVGIYQGTITDWSQIDPSKSGTITPLIPQSGSGTRSFFEDRLKASNGGVAVTLAPSVKETQEHSDADVVGDPNAIVPFSTGRAKSTATISLLGGVQFERALYNVVRSEDLATPAKAAKLQAIFGETGFLCSVEGKAAIEKAGFLQLAPTSAEGECGKWTDAAVSNFKNADQVTAAFTTTTVRAAALGNRQVRLTATVKSTASIQGSVDFFEGTTKVGSAFVAGGVATLTVGNVAPGAHSYTAAFKPSNGTQQLPSTSQTAATTTVKTPVGLSVAAARTTYGKAVAVTVKANASVAGTGTVTVGGRAYRTSFVRGAARVTIPAGLNAGTQRLAVAFGGSATHDAATAAGTVSVAKAGGAVSARLKATRVKASKRGSVTVTVTARGAVKGTKVTGKVTVKRGSKTVGTAVVRGGKATVTLAKLKKGSHTLTVVYSGDRNVAAAKSRTLRLSVR